MQSHSTSLNILIAKSSHAVGSVGRSATNSHSAALLPGRRTQTDTHTHIVATAARKANRTMPCVAAAGHKRAHPDLSVPNVICATGVPVRTIPRAGGRTLAGTHLVTPGPFGTTRTARQGVRASVRPCVRACLTAWSSRCRRRRRCVRASRPAYGQPLPSPTRQAYCRSSPMPSGRPKIEISWGCQMSCAVAGRRALTDHIFRINSNRMQPGPGWLNGTRERWIESGLAGWRSSRARGIV